MLEISDVKEMYKKIKHEGDGKEFTYNGYKCFINRTDFKNLNGYISLPIGHKYYGIDYDNIPVEVHGGLTFSEEIIDSKTNKKFYVIGFDCAHACDLVPIQNALQSMLTRITEGYSQKRTYKTIEFVEQEIKKLVDQLV